MAGALQPQRWVLRDQNLQDPTSPTSPEIVVIQHVEIWVRDSDTKVQVDRDWFLTNKHAGTVTNG